MNFFYAPSEIFGHCVHCVSEELLDGLDRSEELWACSRVRGANDGPVAMRDEIN